MSSIDQIHSETKMLQVEDHLNLLSAQYLVQCLDTDNVCHHITKMDLPPREMKDQIQNPFLTAQSTQIKSVISVPIKDFIHHYPRALFNDIPRVGAHFHDIPGSGRTFTTCPGRDGLLRHTRVGAQFNDIPGSGNEGDNLHQTLSNRVTTASKQQERHTPGTSHLICQYSNRQHEG